MQLSKGLDLTLLDRRRIWLYWVVQPLGSSIPYSLPFVAPDDSSLQSKDQVGRPLRVKNPYPHPFLCGSVAGSRLAEQGYHKLRK